MNDLPRQKLVYIVTKYGASIVENPRRCAGLLRDYCTGGFRREISVLTMALEERVPLDLLAAKSTPRAVLFGRLAQRLCDNLALSEQAARWSVYSWAVALGVISADELKSFEQPGNHSLRPEKTADSAAQTTQQNKIQSSDFQAIPAQPANVATSNRSIKKSIVISADGGGDYASIGEALENAAPDSRLVIHPGVYNESVVVGKNVEIIGDGAAAEIVIAGANASCLQIKTGSAIVRNLTIRGIGAQYGKAFFAVDISGGESILENCDISSDSLSGAAIRGVNANPTIKNCRIHDGADSGLYFFDNARGTVENCDIYRNRNVGAAITNGANPSIKNCRIYEGGSGGVVAWGNGAAGVIEDCKIFGHRLANVGISEYASPTFRRCEITASADAGVYVQQNGCGVLEECDIYANEDAEIAVSSGGNPVLRRCTIRGGRNSGVVVRDRGRGLIESCNIYENGGAGVAIEGESVVSVRRCNIHRNGLVAVQVTGGSAASVEESDLRGNRIAAWESEAGVVIERKNNRE